MLGGAQIACPCAPVNNQLQAFERPGSRCPSLNAMRRTIVRSPSDKPLSRMSRRNVRGLTQIDDHMAVAIPNNGPVVAPADTSAAVPPPVPASAGPNDAAICDQSSPQTVPQSILVIDIGGSKVKVLATNQIEPRKKASG